ncbi:MAP7 domain-containing protein 1-like [Salvia splendens]|uniref:MAP7 domain-containing protein 1-like n=1 Tax=Salvia splendens TaxID=180675 RepID=UPI001C26BEDE|nr:MAP7 domain-containing protein 1-like [Salvia splendens]XP_042050261.1 MAP7 domain-containing protein 1-like [Salvia splendens]
MGRKAFATKIKPTSTRREEKPESPPPWEERPPSPQPQPQPSEPTPQAPTMVSLEAMAAFLRQWDPNMDWLAALAGLSQIGGQERVIGENPSEPIVPSTATLPTPIATSSGIPPEREAPSTTPPPKSSEPSETPQHSDSMEIDPISAHYDSDSEEREARKGQEQGSLQGAVESEETLTAGVVPRKVAREEIDLNELAKKQDLMTDEEFQAILDDVNRMEDDTAVVAEGLDLASRAVGESEEAEEGNRSESQAREEEIMPESPQPEAERGDTSIQAQETKAKETEARPEVPNPVAPPVTKPKAVKRKLVLKGEPKAR